MAVGDSGTVKLGARTFGVSVIGETVRASNFWVSGGPDRSKTYRPAEVRVGEAGVIVCLRCRSHPRTPCIHMDVVRLFLAAQPLEPVP